MRTHAILCLAGLLAVSIPLAPFRAQTADREEFFGWKWGTPLECLKAELGLSLRATDRATARYSSAVRTVGSIPVTECQFEFVNNRLSGIALTTGGRKNSRMMLARIERTYGRGEEDLPTGFRWIAGDSRISYNEDSQGDAYIYCYSIRHQDTVPDEAPAEQRRHNSEP